MRVAVMSDIHGNCLALDKALEDLKGHPADQIVCLGGCHPGRTSACGGGQSPA